MPTFKTGTSNRSDEVHVQVHEAVVVGREVSCSQTASAKQVAYWLLGDNETLSFPVATFIVLTAQLVVSLCNHFSGEAWVFCFDPNRLGQVWCYVTYYLVQPMSLFLVYAVVMAVCGSLLEMVHGAFRTWGVVFVGGLVGAALTHAVFYRKYLLFGSSNGALALVAGLLAHIAVKCARVAHNRCQLFVPLALLAFVIGAMTWTTCLHPMFWGDYLGASLAGLLLGIFSFRHFKSCPLVVNGQQPRDYWAFVALAVYLIACLVLVLVIVFRPTIAASLRDAASNIE